MTTERISRHWTRAAGLLLHHAHHPSYGGHYDPRDTPGHTTEVVHHGYADRPSVVALLAADAEPHAVAAEIRRLHYAEPLPAWMGSRCRPAPPAAVLSSGREVRAVDGGYEVQPPSDNYWLTVPTLAEAIAIGEGTC